MKDIYQQLNEQMNAKLKVARRLYKKIFEYDTYNKLFMWEAFALTLGVSFILGFIYSLFCGVPNPLSRLTGLLIICYVAYFPLILFRMFGKLYFLRKFKFIEKERLEKVEPEVRTLRLKFENVSMATTMIRLLEGRQVDQNIKDLVKDLAIRSSERIIKEEKFSE